MLVVVSIVLLVTVSVACFDVALPTNWPLFLTVVLLGAACSCALGAAVSTFVTRLETIDPVVFATMLPIAFVSGVFQYVPSDSFLARVASVFPIRHMVLANMRAFGVPAGGSVGAHLAVLALWTFAAAAVAVRRFRWAPSR